MRDADGLIVRGFAGAALLWALMLPVATLAASGRLGGASGYPVALPVYAMGAVVCHQRSERSFHIWGVPMPVCARCAGIYGGAALAAVGSLRFWRRRAATPSSVAAFAPAGQPPGANQSETRTRILALVLCLLPSAATLLYEWSVGAASDNWVRALAGMPLGAVVVRMVGASVAAPLSFGGS